VPLWAGAAPARQGSCRRLFRGHCGRPWSAPDLGDTLIVRVRGPARIRRDTRRAGAVHRRRYPVRAGGRSALRV